MIRIAHQPVLLADTGPFCRCAEAGQEHLDTAVEYLKPNTQIVQDVARELARRASTEEHSRIVSMAWRSFPRDAPLTITDKRILDQLDNILSGRRRHRPGHDLEDRGEIATVLVAKALGYAVMMDDTWGRNFAVKKGLVVFTTQDLAAELAAENRLTVDQAWEIYWRVFRGSKRRDLVSRIDALRR